MGNSQPTNQTGRKATAQKLENAKKLGVLSLSEHGLESLPPQLFDLALLQKLRTLDLSKNKLSILETAVGKFAQLKTLHCDDNLLAEGSIDAVTQLKKLQVLSLARNQLGRKRADAHNNTNSPFPSPLPATLKQLNLASNAFSHVPRSVVAKNQLSHLEKLDLSSNHLATVPEEICHLTHLQELLLDSNTIVSLPAVMGQLSRLKVLSLRQNQLRVTHGVFSDKNPQPLPAVLFTDTALIDLNLHGNPMTNTQLNQFEGFQRFLDRRQKVKSKTMTNLDVCGLK